jgi:hypothetical protein
MYIYLFSVHHHVVVPLPLKRPNNKESSRVRQNGGGGPSSSQQDLCEVSGHDRFFRPSSPLPLIHLLMLLAGGFCLAKLGLWEATQACRKYGLRPPVLRKNLCASPPTEVQLPVLQ